MTFWVDGIPRVEGIVLPTYETSEDLFFYYKADGLSWDAAE